MVFKYQCTNIQQKYLKKKRSGGYGCTFETLNETQLAHVNQSNIQEPTGSWQQF